MASFISSLKNIWDHWNIRLVILFSLFLQIFLILFAPSRKRTRGVLVLLVWLAYLLADWAAGYCIGLITKNEAGKSTTADNDFVMAFWGPFLLLHLGGPDTISAFALEDNELWLRHLLALLFQSATAAYVFFLTLPHNTLWLPTTLMFIAGLIKYVERIHALYVAAVSNFRKSLLPRPDAGPNYAKLMEEHCSRQEVGVPAKIIMIPELHQQFAEPDKSDAEQNKANSTAKQEEDYHLKLVQKAFVFFLKFQGLIADMIFSFKDLRNSQKYLEEKTTEEALMLIEVELNFMYEVFYSKASVVRQHSFWLWGKLVSLVSIIASIILFIKVERNGFEPSDVSVTYVLLYGALVLDIMALIMRFFTDYTATLSDKSLIDPYTASLYKRLQIRLFEILNRKCLEGYLRLRKPTWTKIEEGPYKDCEKLSTNFLFRRWSGLMLGHNLLKYCLDESIPRVSNNLHASFSIVQVIQNWCFKIVVFVQDLFYQRDKRSSRFKDLVDQLRYKSKNPFLKELWECVFVELKKKAPKAKDIDIEDIRSICSARGEQVILEVKFESLYQKVNPKEVAAQLKILMSDVESNEVVEQKEKSKSNVDPNKVTTQSESSRPNVDSNQISALLKSLKPYLDTNRVTTQSESPRPSVNSDEVSMQPTSLKLDVDSIKIAARSGRLKPSVYPNEVSTALTSLKSYVDSIKIAVQSGRLEPSVNSNEVSKALMDLKSYMDSIKIAAQSGRLELSVDPNEVSTLPTSLKSDVDSIRTAAQYALLKSLKSDVDSIIIAAQSETLEPSIDTIEVSTLLSLKSNVDSIIIAAQNTLLASLKADVDSIIITVQSERLKPFVDPNEVTFDQSLLLWHIATSLCYAKDARVEGDKTENDGKEKNDKKDERMKISMLLSDYMLYLLVMQPNLMSVITGIGQIRFQDTCEEAKNFFKKRISKLEDLDRKAMLNKACCCLMNVPTEQKPTDVKGDRSKSLLFDACRLFKELDKLPKVKKWEIISCVWVELLSYAACHCRPTGHVQLLSKGGELISFVWLLMVQLGLSTQFQIKDGDARAKLIVGNIIRVEEEESTQKKMEQIAGESNE